MLSIDGTFGGWAQFAFRPALLWTYDCAGPAEVQTCSTCVCLICWEHRRPGSAAGRMVRLTHGRLRGAQQKLCWRKAQRMDQSLNAVQEDCAGLSLKSVKPVRLLQILMPAYCNLHVASPSPLQYFLSENNHRRVLLRRLWLSRFFRPCGMRSTFSSFSSFFRESAIHVMPSC